MYPALNYRLRQFKRGYMISRICFSKEKTMLLYFMTLKFFGFQHKGG